jgi:hypothetical protein
VVEGIPVPTAGFGGRTTLAAVTSDQPRPADRRKADTLAKLSAPAADVWVASASASGDGAAQPYLVPLSLSWLADRVVLAIEATSQTARNVTASGRARLGLGSTRDVVMIDAALEAAYDVTDAPASIADGYAEQSDWDPRTAGGGYLYLVLRPTRIQAWREVNELPGRLLMRDGQWLV